MAMSPEKYLMNRTLTKDCGNDVDEYDHKNTFNGSGKRSEIQDSCMMLFPSGQIKVGKGSNLRCDSPPRPTQIKSSASKDNFKL